MTRRKRSYSRRKSEENKKSKSSRKSQIRIVKDETNLSPREIARQKRAKRERERAYKRRRIALAILACLIILFQAF